MMRLTLIQICKVEQCGSLTKKKHYLSEYFSHKLLFNLRVYLSFLLGILPPPSAAYIYYFDHGLRTFYTFRHFLAGVVVVFAGPCDLFQLIIQLNFIVFNCRTVRVYWLPFCRELMLHSRTHQISYFIMNWNCLLNVFEIYVNSYDLINK